MVVNLFREPIGAPMRPDAIGELLAAASRRAGLPRAITPHRLRHAFGSNAADAGCGIDVVADLLGHASVSSSQVYLHPDPGRLRAAVDLVPSPRETGCRGDPVTGAVAPAAVDPAAEPVGFERVLAGVALAGPAAELAGRLDPAFLTEAGWDPVSRVLSLPGRASAVGPDGVPGRWLHLHRSRRSGGRCVLALLHPAERSGAERAADRSAVGAAAVAGPPGGVRRSGVPADVAVPEVHVVRPAFPPVPTAAAGDVAGAVPADPRVAAVAGAGTLSGRGLHPENRIGPRLLPDPLRAVAHRGRRRPRHRPAALAGDRSPRSPRAGR